MNTLKKIAPHAAILIGNMYYVFWGIDRVNKAMNFIDNGYSKFLFLLLIACCAVNAAALLPALIGRLGRTDNPAPVFVRLGIVAVNALLAAVILVLLIIDLFNEDLMLFLNEFVKILLLMLSVTGLLTAVQVTARERAYIREMNRRAAQRRPARQPQSYGRPAPRPTQPGQSRPGSYSRPSGGYSSQSGYSRPGGGYSDRSSYNRPTTRTPEQPRSRYENRR